MASEGPLPEPVGHGLAEEGRFDFLVLANACMMASSASMLGAIPENAKWLRRLSDAFAAADALQSSQDLALAEAERLRERLEAVLARDSEWAPAGASDSRNCINLSREGEHEYETGTCPHQLAHAALKPQEPDHAR